MPHYTEVLQASEFRDQAAELRQQAQRRLEKADALERRADELDPPETPGDATMEDEDG